MNTTPKAPAMIVKLDLHHTGTPYRTPNKTGHGDHKFTAHANVDLPAPHPGYRAAVYQMTRGVSAARIVVQLYRNGRAVPENHLPHIRAAVLDAYLAAFADLPPDAEYAAPEAAPEAAPAREYIDITPTWAAVLPIYLAAHEGGTSQGRSSALVELQRMAALADWAVAQQKAQRAAEQAAQPEGALPEGVPPTLNGEPVIKAEKHPNGYATVLVHQPRNQVTPYVVATWTPECGTGWSWGHYAEGKAVALECFATVAKRNAGRGQL